MSKNISFLYNKFINLLTKNGKKLKASTLFFSMCFELKKQSREEFERKVHTKMSDALAQNWSFASVQKYSLIGTKNEKLLERDSSVELLISQAVQNVMPNLEVRKVRIAGTTYAVPAILSQKKQESLAIKWIIDSAKQKKKNSKLSFSQCLAIEIMEASKKMGQARLKRDELHRLAEANRAYIRYRWW